MQKKRENACDIFAGETLPSRFLFEFADGASIKWSKRDERKIITYPATSMGK